VRSTTPWSMSGGLVLALVIGAGCAGKSQSSNGASGGANPDGGVGGTSGSSGREAGGSAGRARGGSSGVNAGGSAGSSAGMSGGGGGGIAGEGGASAGGAEAGGAGNGATAGASGTVGLAGAAGSGYPECQTAEDCTMVSDCCGCRAEPRDSQGSCALLCVRDACAEEAIDPGEVACVYGRCVIGRPCDGSAGCPASPPICPEGTEASVVDGCWGACLPPTECARVSGCNLCGDAFCVEFQAQRSSFHCVTRVESCDRDNYCECLGVCGECSETDDAVACPCLVC
jgi:hypothetical protein